jgi:glycosyltransferase involved in cell wall biosynthesis
MMHRRLKVLISAYACEPNKGSEPGVGWEYAKNLANWADIWVVTRENNRSIIIKELSKQPVENLHVVFIDLPQWASFWKAGERGMHLYYCLWQLLLLKKVRELHKIHYFDIFHHITFGNVWLPTFVPFIDIPFIWGPVGGGEIVPKAFMKHFSISAKLQEHLRMSIINALWFNPFFRYCCRKARAIVVKTEHTAKLIPEGYQGKITQMTDVGISRDSDHTDAHNVDSSSVRIICVGSLVYWRGFDIAIRAFAKVRATLNDASLTIIGDGPEISRLRRIANLEGVSNRVIFMGRISKDLLNYEMKVSTIFLNPCLKEGGVTVLLEAMQCGMPVICMDTGGVNNLVPGIKIPLLSPEQTISMLAASLLELGKDSAFREHIGRSCKTSVEGFTWKEKARLLHEIYIREASDS